MKLIVDPYSTDGFVAILAWLDTVWQHFALMSYTEDRMKRRQCDVSILNESRIHGMFCVESEKLYLARPTMSPPDPLHLGQLRCAGIRVGHVCILGY